MTSLSSGSPSGIQIDLEGDTECGSVSIETEEAGSLSTYKAASVGVAALAVAACGGGGGSSGGGSPTSGGNPPTPPVIRVPEDDAQSSRFLQQASFAVSPAAIQQVRSEGYEPWLNRQMNASNDQSARQFFTSRGFDAVDSNRFDNSSRLNDWMIWSQLMTGGSSVRKRVALALSEFFVVSLTGVGIAWRSHAMGEYWDILNRNAFGNFRDLMEDITLNPAMGVFLNTRGNRKADPRRGRVPDENYGREIMQLFTIGLFELNLDGTVKTSSGNPVETYNNDDVTGIAKAFTGYDYDYTGVEYFPRPDDPSRTVQGPDYARNPMTADPSRWRSPRSEGYHSEEEKSFLGLTIPAGTNASDTLRMTLDHLFQHPNVAPFFGKQMIQKLVTSNPSPAYVQRVSQVFENNGSGVRGDLRAVFKAILLDDEALDPAGVTNPAFGKLREPMVRFVQFARTFGVSSISGNWELSDTSDQSSRLGQSPLRSPSVFNFFRPTYFPSGSQAAQNNLLAPEFQVVNETSVAGYVNFMERAIDKSSFLFRDLEFDYAAEVAIADDSQALLDRLDLLMTGNQLSSGIRDLIKGAMDDISVTASSSETDKLRRVHIGIMLIMASTDYLIQK